MWGNCPAAAGESPDASGRCRACLAVPWVRWVQWVRWVLHRWHLPRLLCRPRLPRALCWQALAVPDLQARGDDGADVHAWAGTGREFQAASDSFRQHHAARGGFVKDGMKRGVRAAYCA